MPATADCDPVLVQLLQRSAAASEDNNLLVATDGSSMGRTFHTRMAGCGMATNSGTHYCRCPSIDQSAPASEVWALIFVLRALVHV